MTRTQAVARILEEIGFRPAGSNLDTVIISRLKEAQRELENGKTLPRSLLVEWDVVTLLSGTSQIALPVGFIREGSFPPRYFVDNDTTTRPIDLQRVNYDEAEEILWESTSSDESVDAGPPKFYTLTFDSATSRVLLDVYVAVEQDYNIYLSYYKRGTALDSDIENEWLNEKEGAPEWLIGEAGYRLAKSLRDQGAVQSFDDMRKAGRASLLAGIFAAEQSEAGGPFIMGSAS